MKFSILLLSFFCLSTVNGQRTGVNRHTGRIISCAELKCSENDFTYETSDRNCLNCFYRVSDSTVQALKKIIVQQYVKLNKDFSSFEKGQKRWEVKRDRDALKEGNKYKGGTMEMTEYVRKKLLMTNKRIAYLKGYMGKFKAD